MRAYKGFAVASDGAISCRGHQYTEGETYTHEGAVEMCVAGYHACPLPLDTWRYYSPATSVYHEVEVGDDAQGDGDKVVSRNVQIGAEISVAGMIKAHLDLLWTHVKYMRGKAIEGAASGDGSTAVTSGYASTAAVEGSHSIAVATGHKGRARGAETCWLVLAERDCIGHILGVQAVPVDGDTIRAGALYVLRGGKVVEVES